MGLGQSTKSGSMTLATLTSTADQGSDKPLNTKIIAKSCINGGGTRRIFTPRGWTVEIAIDPDKARATRRARQFISKYRKQLRGGRPLLVPWVTKGIAYRVAVAGLKQTTAGKTCQAARARGDHCIVRSPQAMEYTFRRVRSWSVWRNNEALRRKVGIRVK